MHVDKEIISDLAQYLSMDEKEVRWFLKSEGRLTNYFWHSLNPKTEEDLKKFYEENPFYIFDLVFWHSTRYQKALRKRMVEMAQGSVLDYGGGVGFLSMDLARKGLAVDYADLQGRTFNFAKWLFSKRNYRIRMINLSKEKISKKYDTVFCIDVIEHIKNPQSILKEIVGYLNSKGRLILVVDHIFEGVPLHFKLHFKVSEYLTSIGMSQTDDPLLWIKQ